MTAGGLNGLIAQVGGQRNATIVVGVAGAGAVWLLGRHNKNKAAQASAATPTVMAQGYADTANDPTAVYTGYDQLQQEIDNLRQQPGASNPNPPPVPVAGGSTTPPAPVPVAPVDPSLFPAAIQEHQEYGAPIPSNRPGPGLPGNPNQPFPGFDIPPGGYFGGGGGPIFTPPSQRRG